VEAVILKYLEKNYRMTDSNYLSGVVTDNDTNKNLTIVDLRNSIEMVFSLSTSNSLSIVSKWWDKKELPFIQEELSRLR
jgi:hypothetical protein